MSKDKDANRSRSSRGPATEWTWRHGPVLGTVNAAGGALSVAMVGNLSGTSPWWPAAGGVLAAGACTAAAAHQGVSRAGLWYRAAVFAGAGGWVSWAVATTPWSPDALGALGAGALAAGLLAPVMSRHEDTVRRGRHRRFLAAQRLAVAQEWSERLDRVCQVRGARILGVQTWDTGAGFSLDVEMPPGGQTWRQIASAVDGLAADARLPEGCGVEAGPGADRGRAIVRVCTVNVLAADVPYPDGITPLTITEELPVGVHRDGAGTLVDLLDDSGIVIGQKGSGKTVVLQDINAALVRCPDVLVWHIDLNASGMSLPWIRPYLDGRADRPVIDWVAADAAEAVRMTRAAIEIALARKRRYQQRMAAVDDDKLPVDHEVPAIVIVLDEGAEALGDRSGDRRMLANIDEIVSIGRSARVNVVFSALRATTDTIGLPGLKKQSGQRIGMRVDDPEELSFLFGWHHAVSTEDVPYPGTGLVKTRRVPAPTPFKSYRITPSTIARIAQTAGPWRPALDEPSARAAGPDYAGRWTRYRDSTRAGSPGPDTAEDTPNPGRPAQQQADRPADGPGPKPSGGLAAGAAALDEARRNLARAVADSQGKDPDIAEDLHRVLAEAGMRDVDWADPATWPDPDLPSPATTADQARAGSDRMTEILGEAGPDGMTVTDLLARLAAEGVTTARSTVNRWLSAAIHSGTVHQLRRGTYTTAPPDPTGTDDAQ